MRSSSFFQRRTRANDLRVFVRADAPGAVEDPELSDSDSEDEGELDSPSPTSDAFPSPILSGASDTTTPTISPSPTQPAEGITSTTTSIDSTQPATLASSNGLLPTQTAATDSGVAQAQTSQTDGTPVMSRDGAIAIGTVGGAIAIAAVVFIIWKCRRRRDPTGGGLFSRFSSSSFRRMEEPRQVDITNYGPPGKTQSRIMDDLMAAAYAAEDGNASQYGPFADEKRQLSESVYAPHPSQPIPTRESSMPVPQASANPRGSSNSLYVNQLLSGFYKGARTDGLAAPPNARMPPPPAPSVAGQTEVTATTESTWRTWGWSQPKQPKETWVDKCIRLGGLR
ncbi:hypothetical protein F4677DRAFT_119984 [Hypoxylon crocopeplum]|nr:hypothetical protein F4677DRAFT_119984 [Hypoxylon crocopeplum]